MDRSRSTNRARSCGRAPQFVAILRLAGTRCHRVLQNVANALSNHGMIAATRTLVMWCLVMGSLAAAEGCSNPASAVPLL